MLFRSALAEAVADHNSEPLSVTHRTGEGTTSENVKWNWEYTQVFRGGMFENWTFTAVIDTDFILDETYTITKESSKSIIAEDDDVSIITEILFASGQIKSFVITYIPETDETEIAINDHLWTEIENN